MNLHFRFFSGSRWQCSGKEERQGYERSRFEVRVRTFVAIFILFNRNTLNKKMAVTVYEKGQLHQEQLQDHLLLLSCHGKSHYFRSLCELFSETFLKFVTQKMFKKCFQSSLILKPHANGRNIVGEQLPTLLNVTCYVRFNNLSHVVACCWELTRKV